MAVLDELARNDRAGIVLRIATQPAPAAQDECPHGFAIGPKRELAPGLKAFHAALSGGPPGIDQRCAVRVAFR